MIHIQDNHDALRNADAFAKCVRKIAVKGSAQSAPNPKNGNIILQGDEGFQGVIAYDKSTHNIVSVFTNGRSPSAASGVTGDRWEQCAAV